MFSSEEAGEELFLGAGVNILPLGARFVHFCCLRVKTDSNFPYK